MATPKYDLSHLGAKEIGNEEDSSSVDLSHLGAKLVDAQNNKPESSEPSQKQYNKPSLPSSLFPVPQPGQGIQSARVLANVLPTLLAPELSVGGRIGAPLLNSLMRIGAGTAGNVAYDIPDIKNAGQLKESAEKSLGWNALLEGATLPFRGASKLAEVFNPLKYASKKAETIKNEYDIARKAQKAAYAPVTEKYGNSLISLTPAKLLGFSKNEMKYFTPDVKKSYANFVEEPTFQKLHDLQSQMGKDWSRIATNPNKINTAQTLGSARDSIKNKIQGYLQQDPEALAQYNLGADITKNQVMPYHANKTLKKIVEGVKTDISPGQLSNAIRQGTEKVLYNQGKNAITAIPAEHSLINHLNDLEKAINRGKIAQTIVPTLAGGIGGELLHPGVGGALAGAGSGALASKFAGPGMAEFLQNPWVQNQMSYINPLYYGLGRAGISAMGENK